MAMLSFADQSRFHEGAAALALVSRYMPPEVCCLKFPALVESPQVGNELGSEDNFAAFWTPDFRQIARNIYDERANGQTITKDSTIAPFVQIEWICVLLISKWIIQ